MRGFDPATSFGPSVTAHYDDAPRGDEDMAVDFLADAARRCDGTFGAALEFAIGTGRGALPLAARGVSVDGIDLSPHMVARMREKPGGTALDVRIGDMSRLRTGRTYRLVYLVFNTLSNLLTQDEQVDCFRNAAAHLEPGGRFVVEMAVPSAWLRGRQYVDAERVDADVLVLDVNRYDPATQRLDEQHVRITADGVRLGPISQRLCWPSKLDLMGRLAGLRLVERWGGWERTPYTGEGPAVSVYEREQAA